MNYARPVEETLIIIWFVNELVVAGGQRSATLALAPCREINRNNVTVSKLDLGPG